MSISISLHNTDVGDLYVTVQDLNRSGSPIIIDSQRINRDQRFSIDVQEDGSGSGNIVWSAQRTDDDSKTATHPATPRSFEIVDVTTYFGATRKKPRKKAGPKK